MKHATLTKCPTQNHFGRNFLLSSVSKLFKAEVAAPYDLYSRDRPSRATDKFDVNCHVELQNRIRETQGLQTRETTLIRYSRNCGTRHIAGTVSKPRS